MPHLARTFGGGVPSESSLLPPIFPLVAGLAGGGVSSPESDALFLDGGVDFFTGGGVSEPLSLEAAFLEGALPTGFCEVCVCAGGGGGVNEPPQ